MSEAIEFQPSLRFKSFNGSWKSHQLKDTAHSFSYGLNASAGKYDGTHKYIRITDINEDTREFDTDTLTTPETNLTQAIDYKLQYGDLLFARTGASVGKSYYYKESDGLVYYAGFLIKANIKQDYDVRFMFQSTLTREYQKFVSIMSQRSGQPGINAGEYGQFEVKIPNLEEQTKIGDFFENIDYQLKLHQAKLTKLQQLKKAMLGKMFPEQGATVPEIRFSGFSKDWDKSLLKECFSYLSNNSLSRAELNDLSGTAMNVHYGDILIRFKEVLDVATTKIPFVTNLKLTNKMMPSRLKDGDIIIADAAEDTSVGKCTEINNLGEKVLFSGLHTIAMRPTISFAPKFLGYLLNSNLYHDQLLPLMQGTKVLSISKSSIKDTLIYYPRDLDEQTKIGEYFYNLDRLIVLQQQQIKKLENIKQSFLEKMFV